MNTTITKDQILLKDNEVYVLGTDTLLVEGAPCYNWNYQQIRDTDVFSDLHGIKQSPITHSTAKLDGVIQLQREWFVKGEQDKLNDALCEWMNDEKDHYESEAKALEFGYNAKKGEFSREQMEAAFRSGWANSENINSSFELEDTFNWFLNSLRPLQLPEKIVLSPDGELVEISWT